MEAFARLLLPVASVAVRLVWAGAFFAMGFATVATCQVTVSLRQQAEPTGKLIRIQDVARVEGDSPRLVERVGCVLLGASPPPGDLKTIARNYIKARLHEEGLNLSDISVCGEERVAIFTPPTKVAEPPVQKPAVAAAEICPADDVIAAIRARAARELRRSEDVLEIELLSFQWTKRPPEDVQPKFSSASRVGGASPGRGLYSVEAVMGGQICARALVWAEVVVAQQVASAPRARPLVKAGDTVTVVIERAGFKLAEQMRARSGGCVGEIIQVENLRSGKTVLARVIDERLVAAVP